MPLRSVLVALLFVASLAFSASLPQINLATDRSDYLPGETVNLTIYTEPGGPVDVYLVLTTPTGKTLYADQTLQFRRAAVAAARNFILKSGKVQVPISLATSELAHPGTYTLQAYVTPSGQPPEAGELTSQASFVVSLPGVNFLSIHDPNSPDYDEDCAKCHVDKVRYVVLAPGVPEFHGLKYQIFRGDRNPKVCVICHHGADLINNSQAALRKQVDPQLCHLCHSNFGPGIKLFVK